ncbi:MAG: hypothetical protein ACXWMV_11250 [Syntrophales bacterium]
MELLLVMAPAAIQGLIAYRAQKASPFDPGRAKRAVEYLIDTCHTWSEDGPFVKRYKNLLNRK